MWTLTTLAGVVLQILTQSQEPKLIWLNFSTQLRFRGTLTLRSNGALIFTPMLKKGFFLPVIGRCWVNGNAFIQFFSDLFTCFSCSHFLINQSGHPCSLWPLSRDFSIDRHLLYLFHLTLMMTRSPTLTPKAPLSTQSQAQTKVANAACQTSTTPPIFMTRPRSRARDINSCEETALLPPKFQIRSRFPSIHYGGLQAPTLHPFASSSRATTKAEAPLQPKLLQASAKSLPTPGKFHRPMRGVTNHRKQCNWLTPQLLSPDQASGLIRTYPLTVWSQHFSPQPASSTSTLNKEPNKDTISNHSNFTPEMTFGQVFSFNLTFSLISAQDGNLLTSQARGARQPLPEPKFASPPITDSDLRLLQMLARSHHNKQQPSQSDEDGPSPIQAQDDDKESSSSSESDSSSSSDDEVVAPSCAQSFFVMNKKSHIIHAAAQTNPSSTKRVCFQSKGSTSKFVVVLLWSEFLLKRYHPFFLVHVCASEKHALRLLTTYYLKLSVWEVASLVPEHKRDVFPQMEVFLQFALALSTRCLYTKKMVDHFHLHRMGFPHSIS